MTGKLMEENMKETKENDRVLCILRPTRWEGGRQLALCVSSEGVHFVYDVMRAALSTTRMYEPFVAFESSASEGALKMLDVKLLTLPEGVECYTPVTDGEQREYLQTSTLLEGSYSKYIKVSGFRIEKREIGGMRTTGEGTYEPFVLVTHRLIAVLTNAFSPLTDRESAIGDMDVLLYSHEERRKV